MSATAGTGVLGAIRAGLAYIELTVNKGPLVAGLQSAGAQVKAFAASVRAIGQQVFNAGLKVTKAGLDATDYFRTTGDAIQKMSERTGFSVESLSELGYAADLTGSSMEELETSIKFMAKSLTSKAGFDMENAKGAFEKLGLSIDDVQGKHPEEQFLTIADALSKVSDESRQAALTLAVFGKSSYNLKPLLALGREGIEKFRKEARGLGIVISGDEAKRAELLNDVYKQLGATLHMVAFEVGSALAPVLQEYLPTVVEWISKTIEWVKANPELIRTIFYGAAAITAFGGALIGVSLIIDVIGGAMITLGSIISTTVGLIPHSLPFMGHWFTDLKYAIWVLGKLTGYEDKFFDWLGGKWEELTKTATAAWGGIVDAVKAGDLMLAGQIALAGLNVAWQEGTLELRKIWLDFTSWISDTWDKMMQGLATANKPWTEFFAQWSEWAKSTNKALGNTGGERQFGDEFGRTRAMIPNVTPAATSGVVKSPEQMARDAALAAEKSALDKALQDAKDALKALTDLASGKAANVPPIQARTRPGLPSSEDEDFKAALAKFSAVGTFSSAAAKLFGGSGEKPPTKLQLDKLIDVNIRQLDELKQGPRYV